MGDGSGDIRAQIFISYKRGDDEALAVEIEGALVAEGFRVLRDVDVEGR